MCVCVCVLRACVRPCVRVKGMSVNETPFVLRDMYYISGDVLEREKERERVRERKREREMDGKNNNNT